MLWLRPWYCVSDAVFLFFVKAVPLPWLSSGKVKSVCISALAPNKTRSGSRLNPRWTFPRTSDPQCGLAPQGGPGGRVWLARWRSLSGLVLEKFQLASLWVWNYPEGWKGKCYLLEKICQLICSFHRDAKLHVWELPANVLRCRFLPMGQQTFKRMFAGNNWERVDGGFTALFFVWLITVHLCLWPAGRIPLRRAPCPRRA